jgi:RNA polymerase sigma-70 factor (ECF subfamily)
MGARDRCGVLPSIGRPQGDQEIGEQDYLLARRLLAGEEPAFEEFFAEYFPRLFRFAAARANGDDDLAEEAVQATLIRAVNKLNTFRGEASLFTWLCTICRRELARLYDRAGTHVEMTLPEDHPETRAALETLERQDLARIVHSTLDQLPSRYGEALEWRYIDGLSVDEVADRLGVGYKAAESLLSRARQAFRDGFRAVVPEES